MESFIKSILSESIAVKQSLLGDKERLAIIEKVTNICTEAFRNDKKVLFCGNGGSASDAQHIAAEFSGRFYKDRPPLYSEALHVNTSYLTAVANDYSYEEVFARMLRAMGKKGDVLFGLSTSGNSGNVVRAFEAAKELGVITIGMTGESGGKLKNIADYLISVPSNKTPRIQEVHITIGHIICEQVERELFGE